MPRLKRRWAIKYALDRDELYKLGYNLAFYVSVGPWHLISWVEMAAKRAPSLDIPEYVCECGYKMNRTVDALGTGHLPKKDDVTLCAKCGQGLMFNEDLSVHKITDAEFEVIKRENPGAYEMFRQAQKFVTSRYTL